MTIDEAKETQLEIPFKGNVNLVKLEQLLKDNAGNIPFMVLTITNNTVGGQPVSMQNIRETITRGLAITKEAPLMRHFTVELERL